MVGFDLGSLLQGQMRIAKLKSAYNSLIIGPRGFGALSLRWIQFASVLLCARSSLEWTFNHLNTLKIGSELSLQEDGKYDLLSYVFDVWGYTIFLGKI